MKIERYDKCVGLSFKPRGRRKIEIWFVPRKYEIIPHSHPNQDIKLIFLFGHNINFYRRKLNALLPDFFRAKFWNIGKSFNIRAGDIHYFKVSSFPLLFLNIEQWHTDNITSAATDFNIV